MFTVHHDATLLPTELNAGAGVTAVGIGSKLIGRARVAAGDFEAITAQVARVLAWIAQAQGEGR